MLRRYSFALRPGWVALHVFTLAAVVTMILLGRWQLHVSEAKHFDIQNFGYTLQWWAFSAFAAFFWWRIVRDHARHRAGVAPVAPAAPAPDSSEPVAYRRYVMPSAATTDSVSDGDPVYAAYNDYLAGLNGEDTEQERR